MFIYIYIYIMPKCKNDMKRYYKGIEPSPKGLGYCAHAEKQGSKRKGKDGNMWIIKVVKDSKRWFKYSKDEPKNFNCNNFVIYKVPYKWRGRGKTYTQYTVLPGIKVNEKFYKWKSYNTFETKSSSLPKNIIKKRLTKTEIKKYCGTKKIANKINKRKKSKLYFISFGGVYDVPYVVYIGKDKIAYIYKIAEKNLDTYRLEDNQGLDANWKKWRKTIVERYTELVGKYKFINKFITDDAILLQLKKNKYLLIWQNIIGFEIEDTIKEFYAPVPGSYAVPYAFGDKFLYFMVEYPIVKIPIENFANLKTKKDKEKVYSSLFDYQDVSKIKQKKIN